jgi:hypothetical protein
MEHTVFYSNVGGTIEDPILNFQIHVGQATHELREFLLFSDETEYRRVDPFSDQIEDRFVKIGKGKFQDNNSEIIDYIVIFNLQLRQNVIMPLDYFNTFFLLN